MKTYVITVSRYFPATHPKAGRPTYFVDKIQAAIDCTEDCGGECSICSSRNFKESKKIHTIRANYELWKKRIDEVNAGNAVLSIRYWSGRPYYTKQVEFYQLDKDSGCGVQKIDGFLFYDIAIRKSPFAAITVSYLDISKNDGLSLDDFKKWFKGYDLSKPMAIIQFTGFRY